MMTNEQKNQFVFTLEDTESTPAETSATSTSSNISQDEFDWEKKLETIRQHRYAQSEKNEFNTEHQYTKVSSAQPVRKHGLSAQETEAMVAYLKEWQQAQNAGLGQEALEDNATVVLQEDWLAAQAALQSEPAEAVQETHTVWLKARPSSPENQESSDEEKVQIKEDLFADPQDIPVSVNVLAPEVGSKRPVMCLSEKELVERLSERLRSHLADAVAGMVRVAVQKQAVALTHHLQQSLIEETPQLVDEILEYNFKEVMAEIRYDLKYKR